MIRRIRLALVIGILVPMTAVLLPIQIAAIRAGHPLRRRLPHVWHRVATRMLGLRVNVIGRPAIHESAGVLIASNHVSWLDIVALGAAAPVSYVAKHEVGGWPGVSILAKLQETLFIERERRGKVGEQAGQIRERLARGDAIVLFAEGTTSDGNFLLPFKSALFGAVGVGPGSEVAHESVRVQPVAIVYTHLHGVPMGRFDRPVAAWPGDVELGPHVAGVLEAGAIDVVVCFGEPIVVGDMANRKALAAACEHAVREMASGVLRGREPLLTDDEKR
ncbi:lysophospholipid acyltransferase family protein [Oricola indica]|uniref:lysophospholipid acyltransferase family protein n=1 Tax=Oricola indica TaxID=2872591 RepID=UPI003CCBC467